MAKVLHKRFIIQDSLYKATFLVQLEGTDQEAHKWFAAYIGAESTLNPINRVGMFSESDNWKGGLIWVKYKEDIPCLAHEVLHTVHYVLRKMRIELREDTEEVFTYYFEWLLSEIIKKGKLIKIGRII